MESGGLSEMKKGRGGNPANKANTRKGQPCPCFEGEAILAKLEAHGTSNDRRVGIVPKEMS